MADRFDKFTVSARRVITLSQEEAHRLNHTYIGTEHLLLGLVREDSSTGCTILTHMGVDLGEVKRRVEAVIYLGDRKVSGEIGLTPRAKRAIELAAEEARLFDHRSIGTEHLLLGMLREGEAIACGVLEGLGITLDKARAEAHRILYPHKTDQGLALVPVYRLDVLIQKTESILQELQKLRVEATNKAGNPESTEEAES